MKMQYEKLLLDLMERVVILEEKVEMLEMKNERVEEDMMEEEARTDKTTNRAMVIQEVTDILRKKYGYDVQKGKRADGGGLIAAKDGKKLNFKIFVSKNYMLQDVEPDFEWGGWHTFAPSELNLFDYYIFAIKVNKNEPAHYFIFSNEKLAAICAPKDTDSNGVVHFYFRKRHNGKLIEAREDEVDVAKFYNSWDTIK